MSVDLRSTLLNRKTCCFLAALIALPAVLPLHAAASPEAEFLDKLLVSLGFQQSAIQDYRSIEPPDWEAPKPAAVRRFLDGLAQSQADAKKAKELLIPYLSSQDQTIKKVAGYLHSIYEKQIQLGERSLKLYRQVYDAGYMNSIDDFTQGKLLEETHKLPQQREAMDKLLLDAGVVITHLLYSQRLDSKGVMSYLTVSSSERAALAAKLDRLLAGYAERKDNYADTCLSDIRAVLLSRYKSSDE